MSMSMSTAGTYEYVDPGHAMDVLERHMLQHALVAWIGIPLFVVIEELIPWIQVTCTKGYPPISLLFLAVVEAHHLYTEHMAWNAAKSIPTGPELSVLRTFGVLRHRKRRVLAGMVEGVVLYACCVFPILTWKCDQHLTERYLAEFSSSVVPFVWIAGKTVKYMRFFGLALTLTLINIGFSGVWGITWMYFYNFTRQQQLQSASTAEEKRDAVHGTTCIRWAYSAQTAMMPSLNAFFEEMAAQKRFTLADPDSMDAKSAMQARIDRVMGRKTNAEAMSAEMVSAADVEKVRKSENLHLFKMLGVKVLVGNVLQMWLLSTYFGLTFDLTAKEMKVKLIVAMVIAFLEAISLMRSPAKHGPLGWLLFLIVWCCIASACAKVYFAFQCDSHLWNVGGGCVPESVVDLTTA
mmetsp:Transcript_26735/g.49077  ORF Transcript_26735/g.49077 Transcript_26735/m.49077 type:complete len:407 (+) Transcript_26735:115-1335(+)